MRIGTLTYWWSSHNYGQLLQCWALQQQLLAMGHEPYLVRFVPTSGKTPPLQRLLGLGPKGVVERVGERLGLGGETRRSEGERLRRLDKQREFDRFREHYLRVSDGEYRGLNELIKEPPSADCYVTGSDQVWHEPLGSDFDAYYLPFGGGGTRRVSYAASIGREMSNTEIACFGERVRRLDAVGVREKSSVEACKRVGVRAELVLDSTLLLPADTYRRLLIGKDEPTLSESYIFAYVLNTPNAASFCWNGIKAFAKKAGQTTMATYSSGYIPAKEILPGARATYPMVEGWLSLVRNADFVVTSSFHGVVFAILFHRKFLAIPLGPKSRYADERVVCLLEELGLANRIYHADKAIEAQLERSIDWASVDKKLNALRNGSLAFLHLCTMYPLS